MYHYLSHESLFSNMTSLLDFRLEMVTPAAYGGSVIEELAAVPLTGTQCDRLVKSKTIILFTKKFKFCIEEAI